MENALYHPQARSAPGSGGKLRFDEAQDFADYGRTLHHKTGCAAANCLVAVFGQSAAVRTTTTALIPAARRRRVSSSPLPSAKFIKIKSGRRVSTLARVS